MLRLLIGLRVRLAWNRIAKAPRPALRFIGAVTATIFGLGFMAVVGINSAVLVDRLHRVEPTAPPALLPAILVGAAALSLVTSLSVAYHHLFLAADEELLLSAPVELRHLFWLKLFETGRDGVHVLLFACAALIGYGLALDQPPLYFVVAVGLALVLTFGGTVIGTSLTLLLARVPFGNSLLGVSRLAAVLLFVPVGALGIPALSIARTRGFPGIGQDGLQTIAATARSLGPPPEWVPTTWGMHILVGDARAIPSAFLLLATACAVLAIALVAFERSFATSWERVRFADQRAAAVAGRQGVGGADGRAGWTWPAFGWRSDQLSRSGPLLGGGAVLNMLRKDLRVLVRDPRWRTSLLISLAALGIPVVLFSAGADSGGRLSPDARFWTGLFPIPYLAYIAGSQHGAASLAYEGRNLALLRAAPIGFARLLLAKLLGSLVLVLAITWVATLVLSLRHDATPLELLAAFAAATWLAIGGTAAGLIGAALTADFETDNPQRRVGCLGSMLTSALAAVFFATHTGLLAWVLLRTFGGIPRPLLFVVPIVDWIAPIAALFALGALGLGAMFGARRLATWEAS